MCIWAWVSLGLRMSTPAWRPSSPVKVSICQHRNPNRPFIPFFKNNNWAQCCSHILHSGESKPFYSSLSGRTGPNSATERWWALSQSCRDVVRKFLKVLHPDSNLLCSFLKAVLWKSDQLKTSMQQRTTSSFESCLRTTRGIVLLLTSSPSVSLWEKNWIFKNTSC